MLDWRETRKGGGQKTLPKVRTVRDCSSNQGKCYNDSRTRRLCAKATLGEGSHLIATTSTSHANAHACSSVLQGSFHLCHMNKLYTFTVPGYTRAHARGPLITFGAASGDVTALMIITAMVFIYSGGGKEQRGLEWTQCGASGGANGEAGRGGEAVGGDGEQRTATQWLSVGETSRSPSTRVYMSPSIRDVRNVVMEGGWRVSWGLSCLFFPSPLCFHVVEGAILEKFDQWGGLNG